VMSRRGCWPLQVETKKKKGNERNNVLDVTEILCLRRKDCRVRALIIHFSLLTKAIELDEIAYIL
jgi:hypothetical protein